MYPIECFNIRIYESNEFDIESLDFTKPIMDIKSGGMQFTGNPVDIVADPFLFVSNENLYLFYEHKRLNGHGVIKMMHTCDLKKWSYPITVLEEPYHLSYPFVFEDEGSIYMIPESEQAHSIRLYKAENKDLTKFMFHKTIVGHKYNDKTPIIDYCDSSVVKVANMYYLFTSIDYGDGYNLELYTSTSLHGNFKSHVKSPLLISNNKYGRCGGSIISCNGNYYRVAQDCLNGYGENLNLFKIDELSNSNYKERIFTKDLLNRNNLFYKDGGHQLSIVRFKGRYIFATDAKCYRYMILGRILKKFIK